MKTVIVDGKELKVPKLDDRETPCCSGTVHAICDDMTTCSNCIYAYLWEETEHENN